MIEAANSQYFALVLQCYILSEFFYISDWKSL